MKEEKRKRGKSLDDKKFYYHPAATEQSVQSVIMIRMDLVKDLESKDST